jgi:hypothetical protein
VDSGEQLILLCIEAAIANDGKQKARTQNAPFGGVMFGHSQGQKNQE